eukprot:XP_028344008.1 uncharacterized protein LOC114486076 [Physeter catodon]
MAVNPIDKWRWKELHDLQEIAFNYEEHPYPADLVKSIATNLIFYPPAEVLRGKSYMYVFDENVIGSILEIMRPSNARIVLVDKKYEPKCTKVLPGYPVKYVEEPVSAATRQLWYNIDVMSSSEVSLNMQKENMALPGPNPFIPTDLSLLKPPLHAPRYPELLKFTSEDVCGGTSCQIFFKQDTTFKVPKTSATLVLYYKNDADHHRNALLFGILAACLEIILQQEMADATFAGYSFSVKSGVEKTSSMLRQIVRPNALTFCATGYSDKLPQVFQKGAAVVAASLTVDDAELVRYAEETTITSEEFESWLQVQQRMTAVAVEGLIQVLRGKSYMYVFDENVIGSILEIMRPSNARIVLVDKKYEPKCTKVLPGYPVKYVEEPVSAATRQLWYNIDVMSSSEVSLNMQKENMALPGPNPFIPTDLSLLKPPLHAPRYPELLKFTSEDVCGGTSCQIFFKQDTTFKVPKTSATLVLYYKNDADHHRNALLFGILAACLEIILQQEMADATFAGYSFSVKSGVEKTSSMLRQIVRPNALTFCATGYSDKLPQVFQKGAAVVAASLTVDDAELVRYAEETTITSEEFESWLQVQQRMTAVAVEGLIQVHIVDTQVLHESVCVRKTVATGTSEAGRTHSMPAYIVGGI